MERLDDIFLTACKNGQKNVVLTLLKRGGIRVDKRDAAGYASLHYACLLYTSLLGSNGSCN